MRNTALAKHARINACSYSLLVNDSSLDLFGEGCFTPERLREKLLKKLFAVNA